MPRRIPTALLAALVLQVEQHPEGLGIAQLAELNPDVPRRTLQRHLARLVEAGRLSAVGRASARRYVGNLAGQPAASRRQVPARATGIPEWRSPAGLEVERLVHRPLTSRRPVGYRRELLDRYRPNEDTYLSPALRSRLYDLGRSPAPERPAGTYARQILDRLLIDLSWSSSRLEGNTYTRLDTQNLIEFGRTAEGKDQREAQMILNHKAAIEMLVEDAEVIGFNHFTILNLHAILADNLLADPGGGGRLRTIPVSISGTAYQPTGVPQLIEECFGQLLEKADAIHDPFEQAFFVMVHLPYLQPFEDVNKRVSRLAANIPLIRNNLAPLSFVDIPVKSYVDAILGMYELSRFELLRDLFAWAYERSCQRYTVLRDALPAPDPLRLRYRTALAEIVREMVRGRDAIEPARLRQLGREIVDAADLDAVVAMAMNELHRLHEGNIARFG
ncbi:MAG: Fic family protein, partial [Deltaproteobacteria bacterium]|nr:Fic family protein [Deltaproteobacteria bacterium]